MQCRIFKDDRHIIPRGESQRKTYNMLCCAILPYLMDKKWIFLADFVCKKM